MGRIVLVLGGIKTGKSRFAQEQALALRGRSPRVGYLATARAWDDEMSERILRHRQERPAEWTTLEEPLKAEEALKALAGRCDLVILDCLTLLMTNWLMGLQEGKKTPDRKQAEKTFKIRTQDLLTQAELWGGELIILSNLVENGLVSPHSFARLFQDLAGTTHQAVAARAETVVQMVAGLPLYLKGERVF